MKKPISLLLTFLMICTLGFSSVAQDKGKEKDPPVKHEKTEYLVAFCYIDGKPRSKKIMTTDQARYFMPKYIRLCTKIAGGTPRVVHFTGN